MILRDGRDFTVLHLFSGSGGGALGFKRAGFRSLGSIDLDPVACRDLERLTGERAICADLLAMDPADLRGHISECPDVVFTSPPCKGFSGCLPEGQSITDKYRAFNSLALHGVWLCLEAWGERRPKLIVLENVPRIKTRGREWLTHLCALLHHYGYSVDMRTHNCGEIGGLAQNRERFLLVARQREACMDYLREPPAKRVRTVGEALFHLPSPAANHGDRLHRLPGLSAMNQLRLAAIRKGKDWRDLPAEIRIGKSGSSKSRHAGKLGVEDHEAQAHTVIGRGSRPGSTWCSVTDPRIGFGVDPTTAKPGSWAAAGRPDAYGVQDPAKPGTTVRARSEVQTSRRSIADPRIVDPKLTPRKARQNGGFEVNADDRRPRAAHRRRADHRVRAGIADPRLTCEPRSGAYGMLNADEVGPTIIGYHKHDRAPASVADPRLTHAPRRGSFGLLDNNEPAPVIRGRHTVRQAPAALVDWRGWPVATHELVEEAGSLVLYGPELDLISTRPRRDIVIRAPDGTWHRPMTTRELACLQSFPDDFVFEGSDSSSKTQPGIREHIGNAVPPDAAEAIAVECMVALMSSADGGYHLSNGNIWVRSEMEWAA